MTQTLRISSNIKYKHLPITNLTEASVLLDTRNSLQYKDYIFNNITSIIKKILYFLCIVYTARAKY